MSNTKKTFWQFLGEQAIRIPVIQRDYAQGRRGKERLRENFIAALLSALQDSKPALELDFIYGYQDDKGNFLPLDGQQRLTSLFLLHCLLAAKNNVGDTEKAILKKFGYDTRISSRDFCHTLAHNLSDKMEFNQTKIQEQAWFLPHWSQDPSVASMLVVLEAMDEKAKNLDAKEAWNKLTGNTCPISFYLLDMKREFKLGDELYVKMNARGKQLSTFEVFKNQWYKALEESIDKDTKNKMDTRYANLFWDAKEAEKQVTDGKGVNFQELDKPFLRFVNGSFFLFLCLEEDGNVFKDKDKDTGIISIDDFRANWEENLLGYFKENNKELLKRISSKTLALLENLENLEKLERMGSFRETFFTKPKKDEQKYLSFYKYGQEASAEPESIKFFLEVLGKENKDDKSKGPEYADLLYFASAMLLVNSGKISDVKDSWRLFRRIRNLVAAATPNAENIRNAIASVSRLLNSGKPVLEALTSWEATGFNQVQLAEEKRKATLILENSKWEAALHDAEDYEYFGGRVGYLLDFSKQGGEQENLARFEAILPHAKKILKEEVEGEEEEGVRKYYLWRIFYMHSNVFKIGGHTYYFKTNWSNFWRENKKEKEKMDVFNCILSRILLKNGDTKAAFKELIREKPKDNNGFTPFLLPDGECDFFPSMIEGLLRKLDGSLEVIHDHHWVGRVFLSKRKDLKSKFMDLHLLYLQNKIYRLKIEANIEPSGRGDRFNEPKLSFRNFPPYNFQIYWPWRNNTNLHIVPQNPPEGKYLLHLEEMVSNLGDYFELHHKDKCKISYKKDSKEFINFSTLNALAEAIHELHQSLNQS